jgi:hypothetical protein
MSTAGPLSQNNADNSTSENQTAQRKGSYSSLAQFHLARIAGKANQLDQDLHDLVPVKVTNGSGKKI